MRNIIIKLARYKIKILNYKVSTADLGAFALGQ